MKDIKQLGLIVFSIAFLLVGMLASRSASKYIDMQKTLAKYEAVDNCFKTAQVNSERFIEEEGKQLKISEPVRDIYAYCLADKGIAITELPQQ